MGRSGHVVYLIVIAALVVALVVVGTGREDGPAASSVRDSPPEPGELGSGDIQELQLALIEATGDYRGLEWLGKPIWQPPLDLWTLQEAIFEVRPALLIETGTYQGGSAYFFAQLFDLMEYGRVLTVDIEKLHDLSHPRITYLIGDSVSTEIVERVRSEVERAGGPVMVVLDSNHSMRHVLRELELYHPFVTPGSFLHVQDGVIDVLDLPRYERGRPGPLRAIEEFLERNDLFELDQERSDRFLVTHHPKGWLRRKEAAAE